MRLFLYFAFYTSMLSLVVAQTNFPFEYGLFDHEVVEDDPVGLEAYTFRPDKGYYLFYENDYRQDSRVINIYNGQRSVLIEGLELELLADNENGAVFRFLANEEDEWELYFLRYEDNSLVFLDHDDIEGILNYSDSWIVNDFYVSSTVNRIYSSGLDGAERKTMDFESMGQQQIRFRDGLVYNVENRIRYTNGDVGIGQNHSLYNSPLDDNWEKFIEYNEYLYFVAGGNLIKSDGTQGGSINLTNSLPTNTLTEPSDLGVTENGLVFLAYTETEGTELWVSDGTEEGTRLLVDLYQGSESGVLRYNEPGDASIDVVFGGGKAFVNARTEAGDYLLYMTDGSEAGTVLLDDPTGYNQFNTRTELERSHVHELPNGDLYFINKISLNGTNYSIYGFPANGGIEDVFSLTNFESYLLISEAGPLLTEDKLYLHYQNGDSERMRLVGSLTATTPFLTEPNDCKSGYYLGYDEDNLYFVGCMPDSGGLARFLKNWTEKRTSKHSSKNSGRLTTVVMSTSPPLRLMKIKTRLFTLRPTASGAVFLPGKEH